MCRCSRLSICDMVIVFGNDGEKDMKQQTNNKWRNAFFIIVILIIILGIIYLVSIQVEKAYNNGIKDGGNYVLQNVATSQTQSGEIWITNGTAITTMPITKICQNLIDAQQGAKQ